MDPPWLLLPPSSLGQGSSDGGADKGLPKDKEQCHQQRKTTLYNIFDNRKLELSSGHLVDAMAECRAIVSYSLGGWLMYMDKVCELQCINLVTGERIHPPSITTFPEFKRVKTDDKGRTIGYYLEIDVGGKDFTPCESLYWFYRQGIIIFPNDLFPAKYSNHSSRGTCQGYIIVVAHDLYKTLAFARQGDSSWTVREHRNWLSSFILHKGLLYVALSNSRNLYYDISSDLSFQKPIFLSDDFSYLMPLRHKGLYPTPYLVQLDGHLWLIWRVIDVLTTTDAPWKEPTYLNNPMRLFGTPKTFYFYVFKFDESQSTWVEMDNTGGFAIFVGKNHTLSLSTHDFPYLKNNCIYFTDDHEICYLRSTSWDMGVFNMLDKSVGPIFDPIIALDLPQPTWFMPLPL